MQPKIYMARVINQVGDYQPGDIVEFSRAPQSWQIAGTKSAGWVLCAAGKHGHWVSNECTTESLQTIRSTTGAPYQIASQAARCRRVGYVRHTNNRRLRVAS